MSESTINLHGIAAEIERVQEQLREARVQASPADIEYLDTKIAQLQELHATTHTLCPKSWGVWGEATKAGAGQTPPRTDERPAQH